MNWLRRFLKQTRLLPSVEAYALWSDSYPPFAHNALMEIEQAAMLRLMPDLTGCTVLDLACGSGRYSLIARSHGATTIVSTDNSMPMLLVAAQAITCNITQAPMTNLPFTNKSFDVILCGLATGHLPPDKMRVAFREMSRVVRSGGIVLFSDFHPDLYARGGRRTFTASDGHTYEVEHYPHTIQDYVRAVENAGLFVDSIEEPVASQTGTAAVLAIRCKSKFTASD